MSDWIGRTLSKVELQRRLGRGGMAEVYLGQHTTLQRPVAVKILHAFLAEDEVARARFHAEAQAVAALRHPNIVQVYDFDLADDRPYIVMELVDGVALNTYLHALQQSGQRLPLESAARLTLSLAAALDYAHARNIIHRDVKPANVMLRREAGPLDPAQPLPPDCEAVLMDFGIARFASAAVQTASGSISGTPAYLSPEQAQGLLLDARSDIYSLGVMLYEMLAGHLPFGAPDDNPIAIILKHLSEPPPPIPDLSPAWQAVLQRSLAKDREQRYQHAHELAVEVLVNVFGVSVTAVGRAEAPLVVHLLETLETLAAQFKTYDRALPVNNYPARLAVGALQRLAEQALNEARDLAGQLRPTPPALHPFSPRELEVLTLARHGLTNKEIAYRLGLSERTIQFHMNSVFNKTSTQSRTEAVALALQKGWITL